MHTPSKTNIALSAVISGCTFAVGHAWGDVITQATSDGVDAASCRWLGRCNTDSTLRNKVIGALVVTTILFLMIHLSVRLIGRTIPNYDDDERDGVEKT